MQEQSRQQPRRPKGVMNSLATNLFHLRNPYIIAWWSFTFPGFGHISMGLYFTGFLLFVWEMAVNLQANLNLAILYSFTGRIEMAKEIVNNRWLLLYSPVFVFAVWDSYRLTVKQNQLALLADRNEATVQPTSMSFMEINVLDKRSPWVAVAWSLIGPGLGHIYTHRIPTGFFLLVWWIAIAYFSFLFQAFQFTALGLFEEARAVVDPRWLMYLPSVYGFAAYDAYVNTIEYNRLLSKEQASFLKEKYQSPGFTMPTEVGAEGQICAIPMNVPRKERQLMDTIHQADGLSMFDLATALGTFFMLFGVMWGFMWAWGPILWGLIGLFAGGAAGFAFKYVYYQLYDGRRPPTGKTTEVVLIVGCRKAEAEMVERVLAGHMALSIGRKE